MKAFTLAPGAAGPALLATLLVSSRLAGAAPVDTYGDAPDIIGHGGIPDEWRPPAPWAPPPHFDWDIIGYGPPPPSPPSPPSPKPPAPPAPGPVYKREAGFLPAPVPDLPIPGDLPIGGGAGYPPSGPKQPPFKPEGGKPPFKPEGGKPPFKPEGGKPGKEVPTTQICSDNTNVAACCSGPECSVIPFGILSSLLDVGGIGLLGKNGCQAEQQINCCPQNGGGLLNVQSCGPLLDLI
ncbi:hypothetical protein DIS24_g738 [Lasiodiplodia hormozganensis]|uniref:Hydrophobin n=1 Tax=Lasiodiplodia hormozganensis TaxID=869390 RepID=A0AA39Z502_9PEZI|nr:hypothetical protein DIS24_g738 [Lasiodiplodia hormozganensis]